LCAITGTKWREQGALLNMGGMSGPAVLRLSDWGGRPVIARCNLPFSCLVKMGVNRANDRSCAKHFGQCGFGLGAPQKIVLKNPFGLPRRRLWNLCWSSQVYKTRYLRLGRFTAFRAKKQDHQKKTFVHRTLPERLRPPSKKNF